MLSSFSFCFKQGAGVCFRCLQPTKTHLSHSDIVVGRQNYVPAIFKRNGTEPQDMVLHRASGLVSVGTSGGAIL